MNTADLKATYAVYCIQPLIVRRYAGVTPARTKTDFACKGNARVYAAKELIGAVIQGDQLVIITADSLTAAGFSFPLLTSDKIVVDGTELSVVVAGTRKALDGTLVAYAVSARG